MRSGELRVAGDGQQPRDGCAELEGDDGHHGRLAHFGVLVAEPIEHRLLEVDRQRFLDVQAQERGGPDRRGRVFQKRAPDRWGARNPIGPGPGVPAPPVPEGHCGS